MPWSVLKERDGDIDVDRTSKNKPDRSMGALPRPFVIPKLQITDRRCGVLNDSCVQTGSLSDSASNSQLLIQTFKVYASSELTFD